MLPHHLTEITCTPCSCLTKSAIQFVSSSNCPQLKLRQNWRPKRRRSIKETKCVILVVPSDVYQVYDTVSSLDNFDGLSPRERLTFFLVQLKKLLGWKERLDKALELKENIEDIRATVASDPGTLLLFSSVLYFRLFRLALPFCSYLWPVTFLTPL